MTRLVNNGVSRVTTTPLLARSSGEEFSDYRHYALSSESIAGRRCHGRVDPTACVACLSARQDDHLLEHRRHLRRRGPERQDQETGRLLYLPGDWPLRSSQSGSDGADGVAARRHELIHQVPYRQCRPEWTGHHGSLVRLLYARIEGLPGTDGTILHGGGALSNSRLGCGVGRFQGGFRPDLRGAGKL